MYRFLSVRHLPLMILTIMVPVGAFAQRSPFLPDPLYNTLTNQISGDVAFDNLRSLVMYHAPSGESQGFMDEARWVEARARAYGLEDVRFIQLPSWRTAPDAVDQNWTLKSGELWLLEPRTAKLGDVRETPTSVADNSPTADLTADLIDVGEGSEEADYSGKDVAGKIVLAYGPPDTVKELACWGRGAVGIVTYYSTRASSWTDYPDQVAWLHVSASKKGEKPAPPVFVISPRTGLALSREMAGREPSHLFSRAPEKKPALPRFRIHLTVGTEVTAPGRMGMVEGFIRGTTNHDQAVVLTAHMQEEKTSANDDRSGCANLLEIARALESEIAARRLPRPKRDIRFWWTNEIAAEYEYFSEHPAERSHIIADINEDMVGARQSLGGRVQHVSRTPYSRWSFLNDVVESVVTSLVDGNNAYLPSWQNGNPAPFSRPIFAHLGSREPYRAEMVHYFDSTDHVVFNEGAVGIPGVTFTNWPDEYIHSSDDDLWQIDRTQLQRNAVAVAASALYLANLTAAEVPTLTAVMAGEARERLSHDLAIGLALMAQAAKAPPGTSQVSAAGSPAPPQSGQTTAAGPQGSAGAGSMIPQAPLAAAYADAMSLLAQSEQREVAGFESVRRFAGSDMLNTLESVIEDLKLTEINHRKRVGEWYRALGGQKTAGAVTEKENLLASEVPKIVGGLGEYLRRKAEVQGPKQLHGIMKFEAFNYIDGKRSILDIYRAVRAESLSAGEWYYGVVRLEDIEELFKEGEREKAITIEHRSS